MSAKTTNFGPWVSFTTTKSHAGPIHVHIPSTGTFTAEGTVNLSGNVAVGAAGSQFANIVVSTISVSPGAVAAADSIQTTATISTMPADAIILAAQPASIWSAAYYDIAITATVSAASTLRLGLANSTHTSVTPDAMNWKIIWADPV